MAQIDVLAALRQARETAEREQFWLVAGRYEEPIEVLERIPERAEHELARERRENGVDVMGLVERGLMP